MQLSNYVYGNVRCFSKFLGKDAGTSEYNFSSDGCDFLTVRIGTTLFVVTTSGNVFTDSVSGVDFEKKTISFDNGQTLPFQSLVVIGTTEG